MHDLKNLKNDAITRHCFDKSFLNKSPFSLTYTIFPHRDTSWGMMIFVPHLIDVDTTLHHVNPYLALTLLLTISHRGEVF